MGHNKYIISLKYWESKLLECYLLSLTVRQKGHPAMFPIYIIYSLFHICSRAATSGNPPRCPVVHSSSPSTCQTHFCDAKSLYSFFSSSAQIYFPFFSPLFSLLSRANLNSMENTHTHTSRAGRSPGPVILHLHLSRLADALIQGDLQRQCNGRAEREWSDVGESRRAEGGDVKFICIYYNLGSWFGDLLIPEIHLSKI